MQRSQRGKTTGEKEKSEEMKRWRRHRDKAARAAERKEKKGDVIQKGFEELLMSWGLNRIALQRDQI